MIAGRDKAAEWPLAGKVRIHMNALGIIFAGKRQNLFQCHGYRLQVEDLTDPKLVKIQQSIPPDASILAIFSLKRLLMPRFQHLLVGREERKRR